MAPADRSPLAEQTPEESAPITMLLDHIAAELAAEYVRLMEAAADHRQDPRQHHTTVADA